MHSPPAAVKMRIRATNNVAKLTNVMKLVASSKLRAVEEALNRGRPFGVSARARARMRADGRLAAARSSAVGLRTGVDAVGPSIDTWAWTAGAWCCCG